MSMIRWLWVNRHARMTDLGLSISMSFLFAVIFSFLAGMFVASLCLRSALQ